MNYFLDTNICIYFLKGIYPNIKLEIEQTPPDNIKIASIVKAELLFGAENSIHKKKNLELINKFLLPFEIVPFDDRATNVYSKIHFELNKIGKPIGPNDLILAATTLANKGTLVSSNAKEFLHVKNLKVINWAQKIT